MNFARHGGQVSWSVAQKLIDRYRPEGKAPVSVTTRIVRYVGKWANRIEPPERASLGEELIRIGTRLKAEANGHLSTSR